MTDAFRLPAAVLFDLDGTLIDSAAGIAEALNRTLAERGHARRPEAVIRGWIGDGARQLLQQGLEDAGETVDARSGEFESAYARLMTHYADSLPLQARAYDGAGALLASLKARGTRVALCTNKPGRFIAPLLAALGWEAAFNAIVGGDTLPQRKPDPEPLLHIVDVFGIAPGDAWMVGDSRTDATAAVAAGVPLVLLRHGYARGYDLDAAGACAVFDGFAALSARLDAVPA